MANPENLIKAGHKLTLEEQRAGGKASAKARRERSELKKCIETLLMDEYTNKTGQKFTGAEALSKRLFEKALKGDIRAFEVLRDTAGQKPVERIYTTEIEPSVIEEVEKMLNDDETTGD